jgi:hypothetical protein
MKVFTSLRQARNWLDQQPAVPSGPARSVRRVARLRRCGDVVGDVLQMLAERPQHIRADVAAQDDLAVRRHGDEQMRHPEAALLQPTTDKGIGLGEDFSNDGNPTIPPALVWGQGDSSLSAIPKAVIVVCGPAKYLHQLLQAIRRSMQALAGINFFDFDDAAATPT